MLKKEIELGLAVLKLDPIAIKTVAGKSRATVLGLLFLATPVVVNMLLGSLVFPSGFGAIFSRFLTWTIMIPVLSVLATVYVISLVGRKYYGLGLRFEPLLRVVGYAGLVTWLSVLPFLLAWIGLVDYAQLFGLVWFISIAWIFSVIFHYVEQNFTVSRQNIGILLVVGFVTYVVFNAVLGDFFVGSSYRMF